MNALTQQMIEARRQRGVTLIELMIVVTIVAILAAVAFPSYSAYVVRSQRAAAQTVMLQVADRQEQFFLDQKTYAGNLSQLGFATNTIAIRRDGQVVESASTERTYVLDLIQVTGTTYTVRAIPQLAQATRDSGCGTLMIRHTGQRIQQGSAQNCW